MTKPKNVEPNPSVATPSEHLAARLSIIAAFACFAINCVGNRILFQLPGHSRRLDFMLGSMSSGCVLIGVVLGVAGLVGGIRKNRPDTVMMAIIGLTLHFGIAFIMIWLLTILRRGAAS